MHQANSGLKKQENKLTIGYDTTVAQTRTVESLKNFTESNNWLAAPNPQAGSPRYHAEKKWRMLPSPRSRVYLQLIVMEPCWCLKLQIIRAAIGVYLAIWPIMTILFYSSMTFFFLLFGCFTDQQDNARNMIESFASRTLLHPKWWVVRYHWHRESLFWKSNYCVSFHENYWRCVTKVDSSVGSEVRLLWFYMHLLPWDTLQTHSVV